MTDQPNPRPACPFCGGPGKPVSDPMHPGPGRTYYYVRCVQCGAGTDPDATSMKIAEELWRQRAVDAAGPLTPEQLQAHAAELDQAKKRVAELEAGYNVLAKGVLAAGRMLNCDLSAVDDCGPAFYAALKLAKEAKP